MASDNWQYSPQWTSPKQKKTLNDPLHYNHGNWQLAKIDKIVALYFWHLTTGNIHHNEYHQNKGKWPFAIMATDNWQHQNKRYIKWNCCTLLLASDNWQYSSQWTSPKQRKMTLCNYGNWQLTTPKQKIYQMKLLHFTFGIWQLAVFITMNITKTKENDPLAIMATDNWQHQNKRYITWNCCTLLLASDNWQYSMNITKPFALALWQLTSGQNKTIKSVPKIEKNWFLKKPTPSFETTKYKWKYQMLWHWLIDMAKIIKEKHDLHWFTHVSCIKQYWHVFVSVVFWVLQDNFILRYLTTFLVCWWLETCNIPTIPTGAGFCVHQQFMVCFVWDRQGSNMCFSLCQIFMFQGMTMLFQSSDAL